MQVFLQVFLRKIENILQVPDNQMVMQNVDSFIYKVYVKIA